MRDMYDCVVVGAGAAGMMAAITAARNKCSVALIEHTKRVGSKILQTGNGKCNFTNLNMGCDMFQNENKKFVQKVIENFNEIDVIDFFKEIGIYSRNKNGYIYPHSETAASLQDALRFELDRTGADVLTECRITKMSKNTSKNVFNTELEYSCECDGITKVFSKKITAKSVILATGSKAAPKSGSDGSGYELAAAFGHKVKKVLPALVQLTSDCRYCKSMSGVRSTGRIALYADGVCVSEDIGEIQYTDYGISGIPVFQVSRYAVSALDKKRKVSAVIDMLYDFDYDMLYNDIEKRIKTDGHKTIEQFFSGIVNKKLVNAAAKTAGADCTGRVQDVGIKKLKNVIKVLKNFEFNITGSKGFDNAQVCQGGIRLEDIENDTLQSKLCEGLFFAGEILDVDGKCGGYNLQWAWSSGYAAGKAAVSRRC